MNRNFAGKTDNPASPPDIGYNISIGYFRHILLTSLDTERLPTQDEIAAGLAHIPVMALVTLFSRAIESRSPEPIVRDDYAVAICERLRPILAGSPDRLKRALARDRLAPVVYRHVALRSSYYDRVAQGFMRDNPGGVLVNLGCGLDTRFMRIDDGRVIYFDLDLPEMIAFKRQFLAQNQRYRMIPQSVFDYDWMKRLEQTNPRSILFLSEGVFIYMDAGRVRDFIGTLQRRFPGCELLCEVFNRRWLRLPFTPLANWFLRQVTGLGENTVYHFGLENSREMESWGRGIELLAEWTYFDQRLPKLRSLRLFGRLGLTRWMLWSAHYRLNAAQPGS